MCTCVCISVCICTCPYRYMWYRYLWRPEESSRFAGTGVTSVVSHPNECWELNSDLPQEEYHGTISPTPKSKSVSILEKCNWVCVCVNGTPSFSSCPNMDTLHNSSGFSSSLISLADLPECGVNCRSCWSPERYANKFQEHSYAARRKGALSANNMQQVSFRWRGRTGQFCTAAWGAFILGMFSCFSTLASTGFSLLVLEKAKKHVLGLCSSWCLNLRKFPWTSAQWTPSLDFLLFVVSWGGSFKLLCFL